MAELSAITEIEIVGKDLTGPAFASASRNLSTLTSQVGSVVSAFRGLAAIAGIGLSVDWLVSFTKDVINAATELEQFSTITGSSVESLSRLSNVAKYAGVPLETVHRLVERLGAVMGGLGSDTGQAQKALEMLGISTQDPAEGLQQLADALDRYADGANKLGLVTAIMGRGAAEILPLLKDMAQQHQIAATTSTEQAKAAEELHKQLALLAINATQARDAILSHLVPSLLEATRQFNIARAAGQGFVASLSFAGIDPSNIGGLIDDYVKKIAEMQKHLEEAKRKNQESPYIFGPGVRKDIEDTTARLKEATDKLRILREIQAQWALSRPGLTGEATFDPRDYMAQRKPLAPAAPPADVKGVDAFTTAMQAAQKAIIDAQIALDDFGKTESEKTSPAMKTLIDLLGSPEWAKYSAGQQERLTNAYLEADAILHTTSAMKQQEDEQKRLNEIELAYAAMLDDLNKYEQDRIENIRKLVESMEDQNKSYEAETATLGMTTTERERYLNQIEREKALKLALNPIEVEAVNQLYNERDALIGARGARDAMLKAQEEQRRLIQDTGDFISHTLSDAFVRGFERGENIAEQFRDSLKRIFSELVLRPTIQFILAPLTGTLTGMLSGFAGTTGAVGGVGNLLTGGFNPLSLFNTGAATASFIGFGGAGLSQASLLAQQTAAFGPAGTSATLAALGSSGPMAAIGTALPYIGTAVALATSLFGLFDKEPSQVRGRFMASAGRTGFEDRAFTRTRFGNIGFSDADTQYFSGQAAQSFNKIIAASLDAFDARFSDQERDHFTTILQSMVFSAFEGTYTTEDFIKQYGGQVTKQIVGAAFDELEPALAAVMRGFESQDVQEIAAFADSLLAIYDATKDLTEADRKGVEAMLRATQAAATQALAFAQAYQAIEQINKRNPLEDARQAFEDSQNTVQAAFFNQAKVVRDLMAAYTGTTEQTQALTAATQAYYSAEVALLAQIEQVKQSISDMFTDTIRSMTLSTLSPQKQYEFYQQESNRLYAQLLTESDPAKIQQLADKINQDINAAFGLLSPEQQRAMLGSFTDRINVVNQFVQEHLGEIGDTIQTAAQEMFDDVYQKLNAAADKLNAAADTMKGAANTQQTAANTPTRLNVDVNVTQTGATAEVHGE